MRVIQYKDEQQRVMRIEFINTSTDGQDDSHGFSYLKARDYYKNDPDEPIGLELMTEEENELKR
ncbi:hypothetical protein ACFL96_12860 [Thermoproteota archaeon]